ncbi:MAG: hypothetical protein ACYC6I_10900 [Bacillota bacterium]
MKSYSQLIRHPGNDSLFKAIELSLVSTGRGVPLHLHAEGLRGTGKTTILRSARAILPKIVRVKGCLYNCDPARPHCPEHRALSAEQLTAIGVETVDMPFREISHSAKVGTVAGSIDLGRITDRENPLAAMLPGTIPRAHRGVILVDEINRLADTSPELADILLDVMGTKPGRIQIEETGLPTVEMPVVASIWAASNPDEDPGPLENIRRQLSDRFDLVVNMARPARATVVRDILTPAEPAPAAADGESASMRQRLEERIIAPTAVLTESVKQVIADLYVNFGLESLRAVEALSLAACVSAILDGRGEATSADLTAVAQMVLQHRVDLSTLGQTIEYLEERAAGREARMASGAVAAAQASAAYAAAMAKAAAQRGPADRGADGADAADVPAADSAADQPAAQAGNQGHGPEPKTERTEWGIQWHKLFAKWRERLANAAGATGEGRAPVDASGRRTDRQAAGGGSPARGGRSTTGAGHGDEAGGATAGEPLAGGAGGMTGGGTPMASPITARPLVELPPRDIVGGEPWRKKWL